MMQNWSSVEMIMSFGLILARIMPVIFLCPFLGGRLMLAPVKIGLSICLSVLLFPFIPVDRFFETQFYYPIIIIIFIKEAFIGTMIGFMAALPFYAFETSGHFIDVLQNSSIANVLVPNMNESGSLMGTFYFQLGLVIYLGINGHHHFLKALFRSFYTVPVSVMQSSPDSIVRQAETLIRYTADLFIIAMQLSGPALITIFFVDIVMGIMNRIAPNVNMFLLGMTIKPIAGIIITLCALSIIAMCMIYSLQKFLILDSSFPNLRRTFLNFSALCAFVPLCLCACQKYGKNFKYFWIDFGF